MTAWFRAQIDEVAGDWVLRAAGACVALTYALSAIYWLTSNHRTLLAVGNPAVCWPGLDVCRALRVLPSQGLTIYLCVLLAAALAAALCLSARKRVGWGFWLLIACVAIKAAFMLLDYRTRLNQHYMAFFATLVFLAVPGKRDGLRIVVVLFYVWAGTLKLGHEWLSGAALYDELWLFSGRWVDVACAYVVFLELVVVWFLLCRQRWLFWGAFAQLVLFHLFSFELVGFFYPLLMFLLLAVFALCRFGDRQEPSLWSRLLRGQVDRAPIAFALVLGLLQLTPHLYAGEPEVTGQGRLLGLHMFDARVRCRGQARVFRADGKTMDLRPSRGFRRSVRMGCDPAIWIHFAKNQCGAKIEGFGQVVELDLELRSRKVTGGRWQQVIDYRGFCSKPAYVPAFGPSNWINRP